jgi:IS4 transposase
VKLHLVLDHDGYLPCFGVITEGKVHDVKVAQQLRFASGTVVVDDRGYNDYGLFARWTEQGVLFVTRMKDNAQFEVIEEREAPQNRGILFDETIRLTGTGAAPKCSHLLRRVGAVHPESGEILVFLTNHHTLGASTIAAIYKDRWKIELFFDCLP